MATPKKEVREYTYLVGRVPLTAMLTEDQARRLNAQPVEGTEDTQDLAETTDAADKARRTRKRS